MWSLTRGDYQHNPVEAVFRDIFARRRSRLAGSNTETCRLWMQDTGAGQQESAAHPVGDRAGAHQRPRPGLRRYSPAHVSARQSDSGQSPSGCLPEHLRAAHTRGSGGAAEGFVRPMTRSLAQTQSMARACVQPQPAVVVCARAEHGCIECIEPACGNQDVRMRFISQSEPLWASRRFVS